MKRIEEVQFPEWLDECVNRNSSYDEMIDSFITSDIESVYYHRIIAIYRKVTGKPEVIDLISFSDAEMVEKYGSSDVNKLTHLVGDERFQHFNKKMNSLKATSKLISRTSVDSIIDELRKDGPYRLK